MKERRSKFPVTMYLAEITDAESAENEWLMERVVRAFLDSIIRTCILAQY